MVKVPHTPCLSLPYNRSNLLSTLWSNESHAMSLGCQSLTQVCHRSTLSSTALHWHLLRRCHPAGRSVCSLRALPGIHVQELDTPNYPLPQSFVCPTILLMPHIMQHDYNLCGQSLVITSATVVNAPVNCWSCSCQCVVKMLPYLHATVPQ